MIEVMMALGAAAFVVRGGLLVFRGAPKASTWFAGASALLVGLSMRFPQNFEVTAGLIASAMISVSAAGTLFVRERIGAAEAREVSDSSDAADVIRLLEAAQTDEKEET